MNEELVRILQMQERAREVLIARGMLEREEQQKQREQQCREKREEAYRQAVEAHRLMWLREYSMEVFLEDSETICFDPEGCISTQTLYRIYKEWCREQKILEYTPRSFSLFLKKNRAKYNLVYSENIIGPKGGRVRGYRGLREKTREELAAQYR